MAVAAGDFWGSFMQNEAAGAACAYIATRGGAALGAATGAYFGGPTGGTVGSFIGGAGGSALAAALCPGQPPGVGEAPLTLPELQFTGGQCATIYRLEWTFDSFFDGNITGSERLAANADGPIYSLRMSDDKKQVIASTLSGDVVLFQGGSNPRQFYDNLRDIVVTRLDGQPDNCGNSPGYDVVRPPGEEIPPIGGDPAARRPINVDVDFNGNIIGVNGDLVLIGAALINNGLLLLFNFDGVTFQFNPINGDINLTPPDDTPPEPPDPPPEPPDPPPEPEDDQLAGVFYTTTAETSKARFTVLNNNNYYFPRVGSIRFHGADEQSEEVQINGSKGYAANPAPHIFDGYTVSKDRTIDFINTRPDYQPAIETCKKDNSDK